MRLLREIHRRSLWQVLSVYLVAGWLAFEVVQGLTEGLGLPEWFPPFAVVLLIIGLPVVLATAIMQEGPPGSGAEGAATSPTPIPGRARSAGSLFTWRNAILGGVGAFALWGVIAAGWMVLGPVPDESATDGGAPAAVEPSIAVLPFVDLSPEGDQRFFVEGLSEEIINALAQIPGLRVAARTSTFLLAEEGAAIADVASTLAVANVLEGSVRKDGNRIRVTAQLIEAESGFHLWSNTYDRELSGVFAIQDEISRAIVDRLRISLAGGSTRTLVPRATGEPEAHSAYLTGRYFWNRRTLDNLWAAIAEFERAIRLDPEYAQAHAGRADAYVNLDIYGPVDDWKDAREQALVSARRAVELAPDLGMARTSLAYTLFRMGRWKEAETEFATAIELNPGYATGQQWYCVFLRGSGRAAEAVDVCRRAVEADPVSKVIVVDLGQALAYAGRAEEAVEVMRRVVALDRSWDRGWRDLSLVLLETGDYEEAREAHLEWARLGGADSLAARTFIDAAIRFRETGEAQPFTPPSGYPTASWYDGIWYAHTGQAERFLGVLERLVTEGDHWSVATLHVKAETGPLRGLVDERRYRAVLDRAGVSW